jgi:5-methylthioadenosine/S-adenosylhomocysteine deaminase
MRVTGTQIIKNGSLLDQTTGQCRRADILIDNGVISAITEPEAVTNEAAGVIDARGMMLIPGLVNGHTHGHAALAKGRGARWTLELLLNAGPWISGQRKHEDNYLSAKLNAAEMILKGCTTAYDMPFEIPCPTPAGVSAIARAYSDVGMRALIAPMMADRSLFQFVPGLMDSLPPELRPAATKARFPSVETIMENCRTFLRDWSFDTDMVRPGLGPTIAIACSDELLVLCRDLAREFDVPLQMHLLESRVQAVAGMAMYGKTIVGHLEDLGLLSPAFTGAHGVWIDDQDDIARLADRGCSISHNAGANMQLGSGIAPIRKLLAGGVNVAIGTDGSNSSDQQNMFESMRLASMVSRLVTPSYDAWLSPLEVFRGATEGGAAAVGRRGKLGKLAPGFAADIVFLDLSSINYIPLNNALNQIVNCEDSRSVTSVMIAGRMVLDKHRFTTFDYAKLVEDVSRVRDELEERTADARKTAESLESHVGNFCVGFGQGSYHASRTCWCPPAVAL